MTYVNTDNLVKASEIAPLLKRTPRAIYQLAVKNKIPHYRIGSSYLFDIKEIERFVRDSYRPVKVSKGD